MQFDKICRTCLGEGTLISIFETQEVGESYISFTDMILACATVTVTEKDGFPSQICGECHKQLCLAYTFRRLCENSFKTMLGYVKNNEVIDQSMSEVKWEKDEFIFKSNVVRMKLNERDFKDEEDYINGEEDLDDDRLSPIPDYSDQASSLQIESINTMNKKEGTRKKTKLKDGKKIKLKLKKVETQLSLKKQWPCSLCPKIFKWKHSLFAHEISHIGIKRYFCEICNKNYKNEKEHVKMHKNINFGKFKCEICEKIFNLKQTLGTHLKTHSSNRKKIVCSVEGCNKTFHKVAGLERHELTHTGQRNFICHLCTKGFFDKYQLGIHIRSHTNERPFPCSQCAKAFITSSARKNHELTHSDSKNYRCLYCDMSFSNSAGRSKHLSVHIKVRRHSCRCCGKMFSRSTHKRAHEMNLHGISDNTS